MNLKTGIEWTDVTWSPVVGCTKVSAGCRFCYAKTLHDKRHKAALAGKAMPAQYLEPFETVQLMPERVEKPLHWRKPRRVFVNSVSDLFHADVSDEFLDRVFAVMALTPQHEYQVLTKRPERMRDYMSGPRAMHVEAARNRMLDAGVVPGAFGDWKYAKWGQPLAWPLPNCWMGVSVEDQAAADARIPELLATPAAVRFLSCEPLLGPVDLENIDYLPYLARVAQDPSINDGHPHNPKLFYDVLRGHMKGPDDIGLPKVSWVIVGGESGPGARPCDLAWIRSIVGQCRAAGVAVFVKQVGTAPFSIGVATEGKFGLPKVTPKNPTTRWAYRTKDRKGGAPQEWPEDLRVREFPAVRS